jgi:Tol biopolymer transport system component
MLSLRAEPAARALGSLLLLVAGCAEPEIHPSVTLMPPQGTPRVIDFTTDEGTWLSLDVSPDGRWIAFDLLAHIYRVPIAGGEAETLTHNSGMALNFHPAYSPDGERIAFISDRQGQNNVWVMDADGSNPRPVFLDLETRFMAPAWAPDGARLAAVRVYPTPGRGWHRQIAEIWELALEGGEPRRLLGDRLIQYDAPRYSPDGKYLYFQVSYSTGEGLGMLFAGHRIQRLELATGQVENIRTAEPAALSPEYVEALRRTGWAADNAIDPPAALTPIPSPDGGRIAFGLERRDTAFSYRGHQYAPSTALVVRDLSGGAERTILAPAAKDLTQVNAQYGYGSFPRFAWTPDGNAVIAWEGGKLRRVNLSDGSVSTIPFTARVHRKLSQAVRSQVAIDDSAFQVRFIQWPTAAPDQSRLAFVAVGKVWLMDLPAGTPRALSEPDSGTVQLTPSWSPDGSSIAFTTWNTRDRGAVWTVPAGGGSPKRVTVEPGEYLYPLWSPDGATLFVNRGPTPDGWRRQEGWSVVRVAAAGGRATPLAVTNGPVPVYPGPAGRVYFQHQDRTDRAVPMLYYPFPTDSGLALKIRVRSVAPEGGPTRDHLVFPARWPPGNEPVLSPGGDRVAFQSGRFLYMEPVNRPDRPADINPDPNITVPGRSLVDPRGGVYHSWRDSTTLQYASGPRYVTYDATTGTTTAVEIDLRIPRPTPAGTIALTNAKIITVDSNRVIQRGTVLVRGARITCVGECDVTTADRVLDLSGKTIMPGLFDLHAHHTSVPAGVVTTDRWLSRIDLAYGVTTILDPATTSKEAFPLAELIEAGSLAGPRTYSVAELLIHPGVAWGDEKIIRTGEDAGREINRRADWGAISIKNYRQTGRFQHQLLLAAARERGITMTSEGGPLYFDVGVVMDGQTGWEHLIANLPIYRDAALFFGQARAVYSPTAIVAGHVLGSMHWFRPRHDLLHDAKYRRFMPEARIRGSTAGDRLVEKSSLSFPIIAEGLADIVRAGGFGALGEHGEQPGIGTHWELWSYAEALEPLEALAVATLHGAYFIGLDQETGSITPGKLADLLVLNSDPLADIRNTADILYVMKAGRLYDDETLAIIHQ